MPDTHSGGRHEHGQNHLHDRSVIDAVTSEVAATTGPILEIGPGRGALTFPLDRLDRDVTAVEIDRRDADWLRRRLPDVDVVTADFLDYNLPDPPHVIVGNLPFHQTTAMLRKVLHDKACTRAVLIVQWEVARRRAGVGGATMMTAQWWPWVEFRLVQRVPAAAFRPRPSVDGGLIVIDRRAKPLLPDSDRDAYRRFVHAVFTGSGRGLGDVVARVTRRNRRAVAGRLHSLGVPAGALPKDLRADHWIALFREFGNRR